MATFNPRPLKYAEDALAPYISAETLQYHYGKHTKTYAAKLTELVAGKPEYADKCLGAIMQSKPEGGVRTNAGQLFNHDFYWACLAAANEEEARKVPEELAARITADFGSVDKFKEEFTKRAAAHFGSGWVWLILNKDKKLEIVDCHDYSNPILEDLGRPLLVIDVWEHAYYIDTRNARPKYIDNWWHVVDWRFVAHALKAAETDSCPFQ